MLCWVRTGDGGVGRWSVERLRTVVVDAGRRWAKALPMRWAGTGPGLLGESGVIWERYGRSSWFVVGVESPGDSGALLRGCGGYASSGGSFVLDELAEASPGGEISKCFGKAGVGGGMGLFGGPEGDVESL